MSGTMWCPGCKRSFNEFRGIEYHFMKALRTQRPALWYGDPMLCYECSIVANNEGLRENEKKIIRVAVLLAVAGCAVASGAFFLSF